jgi:DNA-binding NarL/FixJ family response regulator
MGDKPKPSGLRSREQIIAVMLRIGMSDKIAEARELLPETVDLDRDATLLLKLGLSMDRVADRLGTDAW